MASSDTTTTESVETQGDMNNEVVPNDNGSTGVGIRCQGGGAVNIWTTSVSGREDISCSATISLVDIVTGFWLEEEIPTNGTEEGVVQEVWQ